MSTVLSCKYCGRTFAHKASTFRHQKTCSQQKTTDQEKTKPSIKLKDDDRLDKVEQEIMKISAMQQTILEKCGPTVNNVVTNNITNNINIYFNKDLKYFQELVNVMGHENAVSYLLYTLPATKNLFDVINKIFVRDGVNCPFSLTNDGEFVISRGENEREIDPTGALIDLENKSKIKDAVLTAFVDTTKAHHAALQEVRLAQIRDPCDHFRNYTPKESAVLNSTYETQLEPGRLYEILDSFTAIKPKKQDYEVLRRLIKKASAQ